MNCAVHTDQPAAAYCRTCGKPLCDNCKRDVRGVIYCEDCLAARVSGTFPVASAAQPTGTSGAPNPGLAAVLGAIPFGVGAVYNGQYAKGLAHLVIFGLLVAAANDISSIFGLAIAFFVVYQIVDAYRTAKAMQTGLPAPDPFGLQAAFSTGMTAKNVPTGAIILIAIGVLFLLQNMGLFHMHWIGRLWPLILIALGLRIIMRNNSRPR